MHMRIVWRAIKETQAPSHSIALSLTRFLSCASLSLTVKSQDKLLYTPGPLTTSYSVKRVLALSSNLMLWIVAYSMY